MPYKDKDKQRAFQLERYHRIRQQYFVDKSCVRCGATEYLEVDHIDKRTKVSHRIWSWSQARRDTELAKCQVLCGPCHKDKTATEDAQRGEDNGQALITESDVIQIRLLASQGVKGVDIGRQFQLHKNSVYDIIHRRTWNHI